jgi:hypothetical protein
MMRALLYITAIIVTFMSCRIDRKKENKTLLVDSTLTFNKGYKDLGTNLILNSDGTFIYEDYNYSDYVQEGEPSGWITEIAGKYRTDSNKLSLIPEIILHKELFNFKEVVIDSAKYVDCDSLKIDTAFTIVKWTGNIYLLSMSRSQDLRFRINNDFEKFADNYNSGSEPRWNGNYFALRLSKKRLEKLDKNQIPSEYRDYFLDSAISVIVIKIKEDFAFDNVFNSSISKFELSGGEIKGIKEGMTLYGTDGCCIIKVMQVEKDKSYGLIELCPNQQDACKIGDTLTTWNFRDYGKYLQ